MEHHVRINPLPTPTWNRMEINDAPVRWPEASGQEPGFSGQAASPAAASPDIPTGVGAGADGIFAAAPIWELRAAPNETGEALAELTVPAEESRAAVLLLTAEPGSSLTVYTRVKGQRGSHAAVRLLLNIKEHAALRLVELLEPGEAGAMLHDVGGVCGEGGKADLLHLYLGRGDLYSGCRMELAGAGSAFSYEVGYLEQNSQRLDVNLIANHIGVGTRSRLRADGTLKGQAEKTFRGTIDFKRGAKGAIGAEQENVLLLGEGVVNRTVPLILCAEEDVQGDHGASVGELDEDTLFYFASRGMDPETAENLLTRGKLERLCAAAGREDMASAARAAIEEVLS